MDETIDAEWRRNRHYVHSGRERQRYSPGFPSNGYQRDHDKFIISCRLQLKRPTATLFATWHQRRKRKKDSSEVILIRCIGPISQIGLISPTSSIVKRCSGNAWASCFYSQYGNESVPEWERFVPLLEK